MIIDLCSGQGRWPTQEEVIRIDIDGKTRPTIRADIRHLPLKRGIRPRLLHASSPCTYVSKARRWRWGWNPRGIAESLSLVAACYDAAAYLEAETFTLENPAGLRDILGTRVSFKYDKGDIKNATTDFYSNNKGLRRAVIPQDVRVRILDAIKSDEGTTKETETKAPVTLGWVPEDGCTCEWCQGRREDSH